MRNKWPINIVFEVLEVSASGHFSWQRRRDIERSGFPARHGDDALVAHMRAIHTKVKGEYGWPRIHKKLLARGIRVRHERVRRLVQQHGIKAKTKPKFVVTTDSRHNLPVVPDLVQRRCNPDALNQIWPGDITYLATERVGCILPASWICTAASRLAGACSRLCRPAWSRTHWQWHDSAGDRQEG